MPLGKRVSIIGAGLVGLELAEFLIERGREVTVLDPGNTLVPSCPSRAAGACMTP